MVVFRGTMKKLILGSLLFCAASIQATHPVIETFRNYPEILIGSIGFVFNLDKRYVKPNYYGGLTSSVLYLVHRAMGGKSSPELNAAIYVVAAGGAKTISRPVHNFWDNFRRKVSYVWNNC